MHTWAVAAGSSPAELAMGHHHCIELVSMSSWRSDSSAFCQTRRTMAGGGGPGDDQESWQRCRMHLNPNISDVLEVLSGDSSST